MRLFAALLPLLASLAPAAGAEPQALVVLSVAGGSDISGGLDALGATIETAGLAQSVGAELARWTKIDSLDGLDPTRRCGAALMVDGPLIAPLAILPIRDIDALLVSLAPVLGEVERQPDGSIKIGQGQWTGYLAVRDGWAFLAQTPDDLRELPNAASLLAPPRAGADAALALYPQRLPEAYRTMALDYLGAELRARGVNDLEREPRDDDWETETLRVVERSLADAEEVHWSWTLDAVGGTASLEIEVVAVADSELAGAIARLEQASAPMPDAADEAVALQVAGGWAWPEAEHDEDAGLDCSEKALLDILALLPRGEGEVGRSARDALTDELRAKIDEARRQGPVRWSAEIVGRELPWTLAIGIDLGDEGKARALGERWKAATAGEVDATADAQLTRRLFGEESKLQSAGVGGRLLLAIGPQAAARLQRRAKAADVAPEERAALHGWLRLGTLLRAVARWNGDANYAGAVNAMAEQARLGDDRVFVAVAGQDRRLLARVVLRDGSLKAAASQIATAVFLSKVLSP